ncbi:hypothetical protein [Dactylosporangium sp. CA-139066]|uniref:hypothetical protein n=1 Tax=Dactylosporangium sp. CA-139066 TaxID=3239930 RepID=UPI003D939DB6
MLARPGGDAGRHQLGNLSARLFGRSPAKGADTPLWAAADPSLRGRTGRYFADRAEKDAGPRDPATIAALRRRCASVLVEA